MKYQRFEDLPVWNDSIAFAVNVFDFTSGSRELLGGLAHLRIAIERASVSISCSIAEGFERSTRDAIIHFLEIACGKCGECRSITHMFAEMRLFRAKRNQLLTLESDADKISGKLHVWIETVKKEQPGNGTGRSGRFPNAGPEALVKFNNLEHGEPVDFDKLSLQNRE